MKIKTIFVSMLAALALTACSDENGVTTPSGGDFETAYLSIQIAPQTKLTRASSEQVGTAEESAITDLYIVTFNEDKQVIKHSQAPRAYITLNSTNLITNPSTSVSTTNDAQKVSPNVKYVLMVANPGTKMLARLNSLVVGSTYAEFNAEIAADVVDSGTDRGDRLADEIRKADNTYFTMINAGGLYDDNATGDNKNEDCLFNVTDNIVVVNSTTTEEAAQAAAKDKPAKLTIERLASKVEVTVDDAVKAGNYSGVTGANDSSSGYGLFNFMGWEFDHRNSRFFPYALKNTSAETHTGAVYDDNNFYTVDPNYGVTNTAYSAGIVKNDLVGRAPNFTWNAEDGVDYAIENTMAADAQKYGGTTLLVIQAQYAPMSDWTLGQDWFSFGTTVFQNLDAVKTAYATADPGSILVTACNNFLAQVTAAGSLNVTNFADLTQAQLDLIANGGEICKIDECLLWYDGGVNYYTYKIRHDRISEDDMYFGKYGIVRNNWYKLNLNSVSGKGTPWYPGGGPDDPGEDDDDDEGTALLSFEVTVGPWIYWTNNFGI